MGGATRRNAITTLVTRRRVRLVAAGLSAVIAALYFLIGLQMVTVIQNPDDQRGFGLVAGAAFALGAVVLLAVDRRPLWVAGLVGLALVILMYFNVAPEREPHYEVWGILIRVVQGFLLVALGYLAVRRRPAPETAAEPELERTAS